MAVVHNFTVWQFVTYLFLHGGIWHLIFNMLTLWMFGTPLEQDWGTRRFLKYYFICGIGAGTVATWLLNVLLGVWNTHTIGASGAIYGLLLGVRRALPQPDGLDELPVSHQGQVHGDDLRRHGIAAVHRAEHRGQQHRSPGRHGVRVHLPETRMPGMRIKMPDWRGAYRQWKLQRAKRKFQVYMRKHGRGPWVN